jgi:Transposase and inactivated derivatives
MDIAELQNHYRSEKDAEVRERLLMMIWLKKGKTTYEVADLLGCPQSKVMYWKTRFEEESLKGLKTRPRSGKPPKLSDAEENILRQKLESINSWQTRWVRDLIYQETGVTYSERHVVRLLHKWGFERITPRREHEKASEEEREAFKKRQERYWTRSRKDGA